MKLTLLIVQIAFLVIARTAAAQQILAEGSFDNSFVPTNGGIAFWSGGNYGAYPNASGSIPAATNDLGHGIQTIRLAQSSFGQMVAGNLGFPDAANYLRSQGQTSLAAATRYKVVEGQTGDVTLGGAAWDIRFPGAIDQFTCTPWVANVARPQNYFPDSALAAENAYRASLRINPFDSVAARGLLMAQYEQMTPLGFAGQVAAVCASRKRLTSRLLKNPPIFR